METPFTPNNALNGAQVSPESNNNGVQSDVESCIGTLEREVMSSAALLALDGLKQHIAGLNRTNSDLAQLNADLTEKYEKAHGEALKDHLTGLPNRRAFESDMRLWADTTRVNPEQRRASDVSKDGLGLQQTILVADLDRFKKINDEFSFDQGDRVLRIVSHLFGMCTRAKDRVFRYGGDEFVILAEESQAVDNENQQDGLQIVDNENAQSKPPLTVADKIMQRCAKKLLRMQGLDLTDQSETQRKIVGEYTPADMVLNHDDIKAMGMIGISFGASILPPNRSFDEYNAIAKETMNRMKVVKVEKGIGRQ